MNINLSHELRTPLNGIIGSLKLILDGTVDEPQEQLVFIQDAYASALHLFNVVRDLLDIAQIVAGKMELSLGVIRLDELLNQVEALTQSHAEQKHLSFRIEKPSQLKNVIAYGNYQRLLQVLLNLVSNAIKFTHEGGVLIRTDIIKRPLYFNDQKFSGLVRFQVIDTGIGVPLEEQEKLYASFSKVDGYWNYQQGNSGLGLTVASKLVEIMGGEISFYSAGKGLGFTVTFTVPLYFCVELFSVNLENQSYEILEQN